MALKKKKVEKKEIEKVEVKKVEKAIQPKTNIDDAMRARLKKAQERMFALRQIDKNGLIAIIKDLEKW